MTMPDYIFVPTQEGSIIERLRDSIKYVRADRVQDLLAVAREASTAFDHLKIMYAEQESLRSARGWIHSGPRDAFESWLDALVSQAHDALHPFKED